MERLICHGDVLGLAWRFHVDLTTPNWRPSFHIEPRDECPAVIQDRNRRLGLMTWGWDTGKNGEFIRWCDAERVSSHHGKAWRVRRCLLIITGYYVSLRNGIMVGPWSVLPEDGQPVGIAALWQTVPRSGMTETQVLPLTVRAPAEAAQLHARMPALLPGELVDAWLAPDTAFPRLRGIVVPYLFQRLRAQPVEVLAFSKRRETDEMLTGIPRIDLE